MIYFVQAGKNGPIKIGYTNGDIKERLNQLQTGNPYQLRLWWLLDGDQSDEKEIQESWKNENIKGEWFHPSNKLWQYIAYQCGNLYTVKFLNEQFLTDPYMSISEKIGDISILFHGFCVTFLPMEKKIKIQKMNDDFEIEIEETFNPENP
ncbi:MAG: GIY-YIG nuclease family protein [Candidatus Hodarchaeales archaeon]|jgi:hypothetical protein